jgi:hypothetical protein
MRKPLLSRIHVSNSLGTARAPSREVVVPAENRTFPLDLK